MSFNLIICLYFNSNSRLCSWTFLPDIRRNNLIRELDFVVLPNFNLFAEASRQVAYVNWLVKLLLNRILCGFVTNKVYLVSIIRALARGLKNSYVVVQCLAGVVSDRLVLDGLLDVIQVTLIFLDQALESTNSRLDVFVTFRNLFHRVIVVDSK